MAHTLVTPETLAQTALDGVQARLLTAGLVSRDFESELTTAGHGDTVKIRVPGTFEAHDFNHTDGITLQTITETAVEVKLDRIKEVSFALTDTEATQSLSSLTAQFVRPAINALVKAIELDAIAALANAAKTEIGTGGTEAIPFAFTNPKVLIEAGMKLDQVEAPADQRYAVVGAETRATWATHDQLVRFDHSGDQANQALREGTVGRLGGFDTYQSPNIKTPTAGGDSGTPSTEVNLAFHRSAIAFANGRLESVGDPTLGLGTAGGGAVAESNGLAIRVMRGYDFDHKVGKLSFDILYGFNVLHADRIVLVKGADN